MSNYTKEIELALIEYSKTQRITEWFDSLVDEYKVDVKDALIERALYRTELKESYLDPTRDAVAFFSTVFRNFIMVDVVTLRAYLKDPDKMREPTQIAFCEKILKQSNRQNKLEQLL
jgi:hypothetical protein